VLIRLVTAKPIVTDNPSSGLKTEHSDSIRRPNYSVMASASAAPSSPAAGTSEETNSNPNRDTRPGSQDADGSFECNICLDTAKDAVVSLCGHLFWYVTDFMILLLASDRILSHQFTHFKLLLLSHMLMTRRPHSRSHPFLTVCLFVPIPLLDFGGTTTNKQKFGETTNTRICNPVFITSLHLLLLLHQLALFAPVAGDKAQSSGVSRV
jgi:hypothetical protein